MAYDSPTLSSQHPPTRSCRHPASRVRPATTGAPKKSERLASTSAAHAESAVGSQGKVEGQSVTRVAAVATVAAAAPKLRASPARRVSSYVPLARGLYAPLPLPLRPSRLPRRTAAPLPHLAHPYVPLSAQVRRLPFIRPAPRAISIALVPTAAPITAPSGSLSYVSSSSHASPHAAASSPLADGPLPPMSLSSYPLPWVPYHPSSSVSVTPPPVVYPEIDFSINIWLANVADPPALVLASSPVLAPASPLVYPEIDLSVPFWPAASHPLPLPAPLPTRTRLSAFDSHFRSPYRAPSFVPIDELPEITQFGTGPLDPIEFPSPSPRPELPPRNQIVPLHPPARPLHPYPYTQFRSAPSLALALADHLPPQAPRPSSPHAPLVAPSLPMRRPAAQQSSRLRVMARNRAVGGTHRPPRQGN